MNDGRRLRRLRELVEQLEQLPASAERERMLREVRGRFVDVETGAPARAMLPVEPEPIPASRPAPRPARKPRSVLSRPADMTVAPPEPAPPVEPASLGTAELLSLDDAAQLPPARPWTRGLRG
jgi:hypothetical protein